MLECPVSVAQKQCEAAACAYAPEWERHHQVEVLVSVEVSRSKGAGPLGALVQATDGSFYGTTNWGGAPSGNCCYGTVFKMTPSGDLTTLYLFDYKSLPEGALIQATDGNLYGTTYGGGAHGLGAVFQIDLGGYAYNPT